MSQYISLKKASKISGYHPDYLGSLIREGKIHGKKIGRNWFITEKAVRTYLSTQKFLSIKEILFAKISPKIAFSSLILVLIGIGAFLIFYPKGYSKQIIESDIYERIELQKKSIEIGETKPAAQTIQVTTYHSDEAGGIEISVQEIIE